MSGLKVRPLRKAKSEIREVWKGAGNAPIIAPLLHCFENSWRRRRQSAREQSALRQSDGRMTGRRYPWRVLAFAAIAVVGNFYLAYYLLFGLASDGVDVRDASGRAVVTEVWADSPAERAGMKTSDLLVEVKGQRIGNVVDWLSERMNFERDKPIAIRVERAGQPIDLKMVVHGRTWDDFGASQKSSQIIFLANKFITLVIGLFVVFSRPKDLVSRLGGGVLVSMATVYEAFQWGMAASIRALPVLVAIAVMLVYVSAAIRTPLLAGFFCLFPKKLFTNRWAWAAFVAGPLLSASYSLYLLARTVYDPEHLSGLTRSWVLAMLGLQSLVYLVLALVVVVLNYRRLESVTDRRRFRAVSFGALLGMVFYLPRVMETALVEFNPAWSAFLESPTTNLVCSVGMLVFPLSFAYAILKHKLFDVRVMIRRGLQYALARNFLRAIPVVAAGVLVLDIVFHGRQPLFGVLKSRGAVYVAIAALAALAYAQRQTWLSGLDRRFFRDKYDAHQLFREIVEEVRHAGSVEQVAPSGATRVADALHAEFCALLQRRPGEPLYRVVAAPPVGALTADLPATNKLIPLVRMLDRSVPITLAESGWLGQQLPQVDKDFLHNARIELLVPVALEEGQTEVLLVMGAKRSEEPYSSEDTVLLENVASALGLLLMRGAAMTPGRSFEECAACGTCYDTGTTRCEKDRTLLTLVASARMLGERYRLEKRLGQGGMGKVYRATDLSLNRAVAVKMIRDEFFANQRAVEKFRQESQVTGSFTHPNVVTVHDFGVDTNQRVFLVMELLEGITLREEMRGKKRLTAERTLELFGEMCAGIAAAHARGLVHRDLKPENIFLSRTNTREMVKITDFGIAKVMPEFTNETSNTATGVLVGTMRYMSPEQLRGGAMTARWDIWALSVMAYEALCGSAPFEGADFATLQCAILGLKFPGVGTLVPEAPRKWQEFFARAFAKEEGERPESAEVFWRELMESVG
jgi:tRNA A-37 threonylcarbamoyl transferase component Bud32